MHVCVGKNVCIVRFCVCRVSGVSLKGERGCLWCRFWGRTGVGRFCVDKIYRVILFCACTFVLRGDVKSRVGERDICQFVGVIYFWRCYMVHKNSHLHEK